MSDTNAQEAAENAVADMIFGPEETPEEELPSGDDHQVEPVEEGEESEEVEAVEESKDESDEEESGDPIVEFEWNGQIIEAPQSIKDSLMLQQDYTQKTQSLSAERKTFEVAAGEIQMARDDMEFAESVIPEVLQAQQMEATANEWHQYMKQNIDSLSHTDIEKIRMTIEEARTQRDNLVQSITAKQQEHQQAREQSFGELLNKGTEVLRSKIPNWNDEVDKATRDYGMTLGFTEAEVTHVADPRQLEVLWKAKQYDDLKAGKTAAVKTVQAAPSIKSKARNPMPKETQDKLNLRKKLKSNKLSNADKAGLIGENIANKFFS